jgi:hypothetical protein
VRALLLAFTLSFGDPPTVQPHAPVAPEAPNLYLMPKVTSRFGMPAEYAEAQQTFEDAQKLYESGKPEKAAPLFLKVAELVKPPKKETNYTESFTKMRGIAYQDATLAFKLAGDKQAAKAALTAAQKNDPANAALLKKLIGEL